MGKADKNSLEDMYTSDRFMESNIYHEADSPWKIEKLKPYINSLIKSETFSEISLLDVGGGTGLILRETAKYIEEKHSVKTRQMAIDLSPGYLELQKKNNPAIEATYNCSVESTPFDDKQIDVTLMIDVLEHLYNTKACLNELRRISRYVLFKVPLEQNLTVVLLDLLTGHKKKRASADSVGHINHYSFNSLKSELEEHLGTVVSSSYTDVFSFLLSSKERRKDLSLPRMIYCHIARLCYKISPAMTAFIFNDFAIFLVKSH